MLNRTLEYTKYALYSPLTIKIVDVQIIYMNMMVSFIMNENLFIRDQKKAFGLFVQS